MPTTPTLPSISLKDRTVPAAVLKRVSFDTMKRFQVAAFEEDEKELKLAIVYPEQLKQGFFTALKDMESKVGRTIRLFKSDPQTFQALLKQYPQGSVPAPVAKPVQPTQSTPSTQPTQPAPATTPSIPSAPKSVPVNGSRKER